MLVQQSMLATAVSVTADEWVMQEGVRMVG